MTTYTKNQLDEMKQNASITRDKLSRVKKIFDSKKIEFEKSQYPTTSDGSRYDVTLRFDRSLFQSGSLENGFATISIDTFNYIQVDMSQATEVIGLTKKLEFNVEHNERSFKNRMSE